MELDLISIQLHARVTPALGRLSSRLSVLCRSGNKDSEYERSNMEQYAAYERKSAEEKDIEGERRHEEYALLNEAAKIRTPDEWNEINKRIDSKFERLLKKFQTKQEKAFLKGVDSKCEKSKRRILRASFHQASQNFNTISFNQCAGMVLATITRASINPIHLWKGEELDEVIIAGDRIHYDIVKLHIEGGTNSVNSNRFLNSEHFRIKQDNLEMFGRQFRIDLPSPNFAGILEGN